MPDTDTKIISLLKRLSVVAPERCKDTGFPSFAIRALAMLCEGDWVVVGTLYKDGWEFTAPIIHYAVLEEAHARGWEWSLAWCFGMDANTPARRAYRLYPRDYDYFTLERPIAEITESKEDGILEREVLPRLEALVLALETQP